MRIGAIIVCAGKGRRLGREKASLFLDKKPLFYYSLKAFLETKEIKEIVLVLQKKHFPLAKRFISCFSRKIIKLTEGGRERSDSVYHGLSVLDRETTHVIIHDGARPFVDKEIIKEVMKKLERFDAVICGIESPDTLKVVRKGWVLRTLDRENIFSIQTPQGFFKKTILEAYRRRGKKRVFDDAQLLERLGKKIKVVRANPLNIKITYPEDILLAKAILKIKDEGCKGRFRF